jgi:hypothetical protein
MGAETFFVRAKGASAQSAFADVVREACYEHGNRGYTGTIAEKDCFTLIPVPAGVAPRDFAHKLLDEQDERIDDKWGPAGCVKVAEGEWIFFGVASS